MIAWFFARKPSRILEYIGKFLNPVFLVLLAIILLFALVIKMAKMQFQMMSLPV
nr:branched-chain amino acid transport system II carrier protein [Staphylococcus aureus]